MILRATINLDYFSRARYTCPNCPFPRGLPISKLSIFHCKGSKIFFLSIFNLF